MADVHWIDFGRRLERAMKALKLGYGTAAAEIGINKTSFYRACNGTMPNGDNYVKMLHWLKNSQRRIGRKRAAAAARRAIRRSKHEQQARLPVSKGRGRTAGESAARNT